MHLGQKRMYQRYSTALPILFMKQHKSQPSNSGRILHVPTHRDVRFVTIPGEETHKHENIDLSAGFLFSREEQLIKGRKWCFRISRS